MPPYLRQFEVFSQLATTCFGSATMAFRFEDSRTQVTVQLAASAMSFCSNLVRPSSLRGQMLLPRVSIPVSYSKWDIDIVFSATLHFASRRHIGWLALKALRSVLFCIPKMPSTGLAMYISTTTSSFQWISSLQPGSLKQFDTTSLISPSAFTSFRRSDQFNEFSTSPDLTTSSAHSPNQPAQCISQVPSSLPSSVSQPWARYLQRQSKLARTATDPYHPEHAALPTQA
jgi:hypothetical protein